MKKFNIDMEEVKEDIIEYGRYTLLEHYDAVENYMVTILNEGEDVYIIVQHKMGLGDGEIEKIIKTNDFCNMDYEELENIIYIMIDELE